MIKVRNGITRRVFLVGRYAIKTPQTRNRGRFIVQGMRSNLSERRRSRYWYFTVAPVLWCSWGGVIMVMRRAQPYPEAQVHQKHLCGLTSDHKPENYGVIDGRVVCVDYA